MKRSFAMLSVVIGSGLFIYIIKQTGLEEIGQRLKQVRAGFLLILLISGFRYLTRSLSWFQCITPDRRDVGFWTLWRARLAGEAMGDLTVGPVVAEPLRLVALGERLALSSRVSSLAVENVTYTASSCVMVMIGGITLLTNVGLHGSLHTALLATLGGVVLVMLSSILAIRRRLKITSGIASLAGYFFCNVASMDKMRLKLARLSYIENYLYDFFAKRPVDFLLVMLCHTGFHLAGVAEVFVTMRLIGAEVSFTTALLMESVNRAINIAFVFVPALVGVDELSTRELAELMGFDGSLGVTLAIIRKIRMFFWVGIGLFFLGAVRRKS